MALTAAQWVNQARRDADQVVELLSQLEAELDGTMVVGADPVATLAGVRQHLDALRDCLREADGAIP